MSEPTLHELRTQLHSVFDDVEFDAFCFDYFPEVYDRFSRGLRRDEKINLLLSYCRNKDSLGRLNRLLTASPTTILDPKYTESYLGIMQKQFARLETRPYRQISEKHGGLPSFPIVNEAGTEGATIQLCFDLYRNRTRMMSSDEKTIVDADENASQLSEQDRTFLNVDLCSVLAEPGHLVLLGQAGSGKTTVLHFIATVLAIANRDYIEEYLGLKLDQLPLPVFVSLREFEHACQTKSDLYSRDVAGFLRFVDDHFQRWHSKKVPRNFVSDIVRAGHSWLLLDALDEVADYDHRVIMRRVIEQLAGEFRGNRLIVTSRVAVYEQATSRLDNRFNSVMVRDLTREQWISLIAQLYRGLEAQHEIAEQKACKLRDRIDNSAMLQKMVRTPLMVWTATLIHYIGNELPEQRAELYRTYVDVLLGERLHEEEDAESAQVLREDPWPMSDRILYLTYAAYTVHQSARQGNLDRSSKKDALVIVDEHTLVQQGLVPIMTKTMMLEGTEYQIRRRVTEEAKKFLAFMVARSGLLYAHPEGYSFGDHLTIQEFLAAFYLVENASNEERTGFLETCVGDSWWREVVLLMAGCLLSRSRRAQTFLLEELSELPGKGDTHAYGLIWAGQALLEIPESRASWHRGVRTKISEKLIQVLRHTPAETSVATRIGVGNVLGILGDIRFQGECCLPEFISVPGGEYWIGSSEEVVKQLCVQIGKEWPKDEGPRHQVAISPFSLAKYPTTNAMFFCFKNDASYLESRWWEEAKNEGHWDPDKGFLRGNQPYFWDDKRVNDPNQPVVGVSWYEAVAYCRWLTAKLDDGYTYRLLTETEWEIAARGVDERQYAWGDEWKSDLANTKELELECTTPIGIFPEGATPRGLLDMTGSVWEWCSDWFDPDEYSHRVTSMPTNPDGPITGAQKVLRGGSWYNEAAVVRCAVRGKWNPIGRFDYVGFRVARVHTKNREQTNST